MAALERCPEQTVVASTSAARLHGLWLPDDSDDIHLATATPDAAAHQMTRTRRPEFRPHRRSLTDNDRTTIRGMRGSWIGSRH